MTVYTKQALVASFPAYDIFEREVEPRRGCINITSADILGLDSGKGFHRRYTPSSAASYALENNKCPIEAYNRAVELGHETHWLRQCSTALTSHAQAKEELVQVTLGQAVFFEGRYFTIEHAPNNNLRLIPAKK